MGKDLGDNAKKFLFDNNDFSEEAQRRKREEARKPTFSAEQMEASKNAGFNEGRKAGIQETLDSQESQIRDTLQQVVMAAARLEAEENKRLATFINQSALVTAQALTHTMPALLQIMGATQIETFMQQVLSELAKGQALVIHVPPAHYDQISARYTALAEKLRRKGACTIVPDPSLTGLECRMDWTGGGAEWNPQAVATKLLETIIAHLPEELRPMAQLPSQTVDETQGTPHNEQILTGDVP
ncbi:MAG: hypothetical protein KGQ41_06815 [Alphaproteobacteria bacterium]|nr:hypothetical protein [Alphaproteobacteria bacterium]